MVQDASAGTVTIRILSLFFMSALAMRLLTGLSAVADQTDPRLGTLFVQLKGAPTAETARALEAEIWNIWMQSGNDRVDGLMASGVMGLNRADYDRALDAFSQIVTLAPNFAEGWNKRATTLYLMGRFSDSIKDIEKVLVLEPRHFGALSGLGLCDTQLNKPKEALSAFERALNVDPNMPGLKLRVDELKKRLERESI